MKYGESVEVQFRGSIDVYRQFLVEIIQNGFTRLCIAGASLPTIGDSVNMSEVANKRSEIRVGIKQRTELTLRYNDKLIELAKYLGASYFDISDAVLDKSSSLVHHFFYNPIESDYHLDKQKVVGIWAAKCNAFVDILL